MCVCTHMCIEKAMVAMVARRSGRDFTCSAAVRPIDQSARARSDLSAVLIYSLIVFCIIF